MLPIGKKPSVSKNFTDLSWCGVCAGITGEPSDRGVLVQHLLLRSRLHWRFVPHDSLPVRKQLPMANRTLSLSCHASAARSFNSVDVLKWLHTI